MTSLLISVINEDEAQIALDFGADIIDLKNPSAGALGALPLAMIQTIISKVNGQKKVSATIGDIPMDAALICERIECFKRLKLDYIKIGFFETQDYASILSTLAHYAKEGVQLIAVLFAEYDYPHGLIQQLQAANFIGVMMDTAHKNGQSLFSHYSIESAGTFVKEVQSNNMLAGIAGSLTIEHIAAIKTIAPNYVGFRGGACDENKRMLGLNKAKVMQLGEML